MSNEKEQIFYNGFLRNPDLVKTLNPAKEEIIEDSSASPIIVTTTYSSNLLGSDDAETLIYKDVITETTVGTTVTTTINRFKSYDTWNNRTTATYTGLYNAPGITSD